MENNIYELKTSIQEVGDKARTKVQWIFKNAYEIFHKTNINEVCTSILKPHADCDCDKFRHPDNFRLKLKIHEYYTDDSGSRKELKLYYSCVGAVPVMITVRIKEGDTPTISRYIPHIIPGWQYLCSLTATNGKICIKLDMIIDMPIHLEHLKNIEVIKTLSAQQQCGDMQDLLHSGSFSDVTLLSADGTPFKTHRAILASRSEMFKAMFQHDQNTDVTSAYTADVLREILFYIYSGKTSNVCNMPDALIVAADYYQLSGLKNLCAVTLRDQISPENAIRTLELAMLYSLTELVRTTVQYIQANGDLVIKTEGWKNIKSLDSLRKLFEIVYGGANTDVC